MRSRGEAREAGESPAPQMDPSTLPAEARGRLGREVLALQTELLQARRVHSRPARDWHAAPALLVTKEACARTLVGGAS